MVFVSAIGCVTGDSHATIHDVALLAFTGGPGIDPVVRKAILDGKQPPLSRAPSGSGSTKGRRFMSRNTAAVWITGIVCATVLVFGVFLWPTPYRYEKISLPPGTGVKSLDGLKHAEVVYRINRFTGNSVMVIP